MITEIKGNILNATDQIVGHCCNTQNTMNSGVAKALRTRFPEIYKADSAAYITYGVKLLGMSIPVKIETGANLTPIIYVANLYGQPNYGYNGDRYVDYEAMYQSLEMLRDHIEVFKFKSVALPYKIGSDRAGGHWPIVLEMIKHTFDGSNININLYRL